MRLQICRRSLQVVVLLGLGAAVLAQAQSAYTSPYAGQYGSPYASPQYSQPQGYGQSYPQQGYAGNYAQQGYPQQGYAPAQASGQAMSAGQLEQLVAPIALYPDTLVAQVLAAATYPAQVAQADAWISAQGGASPYEIAGGADAQNWDPSVKGLTAFPQVLTQMDRNQRWTTDLGNAYYNQPQDVLEAVQVMRQRAQAAGNLRDTPEENVSYSAGAIELAPPNPQMVYVPQYNPWNVYGDPVTPYPGFSLLGAIGSFFNSGVGSSALSWGSGIAMAAFDHTPFGWVSWGLNWLADTIFFHHSNYATQSTSVADWGIRSGGARAFAGRGVGNGYVGPSGGNRVAMNSGYAAATQRYAPIERSYPRPQMDAYNRMPAPVTRTPVYARPESRLAYGPEYYNGGRSSYAERGYSSPVQSYRAAPAESYRGDSAYGSYDRGAYSGRESFGNEKVAKPSGFHPFGGGSKEPSFKEPKYSAPKFKEPKFKAPKMSGGHSSGHSGGGLFSKHRG